MMQKKNKLLLIFIFMSYGCTISILIDEAGRNFLTIFAGFVSLLTVFVNYKYVVRDFPWSIPLFIYMFSVRLFTDNNSNIISLIVTFIYSMGYYAVTSLAAQSWCDEEFIASLFAKIIYSYAAVSLIQLICSSLGIYVPNLLGHKEGISFNSLALEPSHLARILGITFLAYLLIKQIDFNKTNYMRIIKREKYILLAFLVTMILSGSATAVMAIPVSILFSVKYKNSLPILLTLGVVITILVNIDYEPIQRVFAFIPNLLALDQEALVNTDNSSAVRVLPFLIYLNDARPYELSFWFGYGPDGMAEFFRDAIKGIKDYSGEAGFIPGFAVVYGILGNILYFWTFLFNYRLKNTLPIIFFFIMFYFTSPLNSPLMWYALIVFELAFESMNKKTRRYIRVGPKKI